MNGIIAKDIGYLPLPKTASTTVSYWLYAHIYGKEFKIEDSDTTNIHRHMRKHHWGNLADCSKRIIVLRDPLERFVSGYKGRVLGIRELSEDYIKRRHPELIDQFKYDPSFSDFISNFHTYMKVDSIHHHFRPISDFMNGEDLNFFTDRFNMNEVYKARVLIDKSLEKYSKQKSQKKEINVTSAEELVKKFYKHDYQLFNSL